MSKSKSKCKKIQIGNKSLKYEVQVTHMKDANNLLSKGDFEALREQLEVDGYLFLRGVISDEFIIGARELMLNQAHTDESILTDHKYCIDDAIIAKHNNKYAQGYCFDGITGSETNSRANIDIEAWQDITASETCQNVYNGSELNALLNSLFGNAKTKALLKQTFLRLMGKGGTIEHADYFYFKRDTDIFTGENGIDAQNVSRQYLQSQKNKNKINIISELKDSESDTKEEKCEETNAKCVESDEKLECDMCGKVCALSELSNEVRERLMKYWSGNKADFGMEGEWYCPECSGAPLSIYTIWICLDNLTAPNDSILCMCPKSHKLQKWNIPKLKNAQLPGDFNWQLPWVIPESIRFGDIILFNIKTVHAASFNKSKPLSYRCSFDTRIQLAPID